MNSKVKWFILYGIMLVVGCKNEQPQQYSPQRDQLKNDLVNVNKMLVDKDHEQIKAYVERRNWEMEQSSTGLWYMKTVDGQGDSVKTEKQVTLNYQVELLDGTFCYSSDSLGAKTFRVGKGGVERGLEELVLKLKEGDEAIAIMPPHLAYGLIGDENRIPARATIVYKVEIIKITD